MGLLHLIAIQCKALFFLLIFYEKEEEKYVFNIICL